MIESGSTEPALLYGKPPPWRLSESLRATPVKHTVIYVNPLCYGSPLKLMRGDRHSPFGCYITSSRIKEETRPVGVLPHHYRSYLILREPMVLRNRNGTQAFSIRDINGKGMGGWRYITVITSNEDGKTSSHGEMQLTKPVLGANDEPEGICEKGFAEWDAMYSNFLLEHGMRTHVTLGIVALEEIVHNGRKIPVVSPDQWSVDGYNISGEEKRPVIELRGFRTMARIENAEDPLLLEDAITLVEDERSPQEKFPQEPNERKRAYLRWFTTKLAEQVALMHALKRHHRYLRSYNITLACEITDLDSMDTLSQNERYAAKQRAQDKKDATAALQALAGIIARALKLDANAAPGLIATESHVFEQLYRKKYPRLKTEKANVVGPPSYADFLAKQKMLR